jgi:hypothetical protein
LSVEPGRSFSIVYLRAAQAYMLISMPTGTWTIFGAFQVISFSQVFDSLKFDAKRRAALEPRTTIGTTQVRHIAQRTDLSAETSLLSKTISFLDKA